MGLIAEPNDCGFWIAECGIEGFAIWDVRFKTEDAGYRIRRLQVSDCGIKIRTL